MHQNSSATTHARRLVLVTGLTCTLSACGSSDDTAHPPTTAAKPPVLSSAAIPSTTPGTPSTTPGATQQLVPTPSTTAQAAPAVMPYVVCMNLQDAQNKIHDAGVFYSRSKDATGRGRHQVIDRNWLVVAQSPAPGTSFGEGDAVLSVVKYGESNNC